MSDIRNFMTDDHRRCDDLFADAEQALADKNMAAAIVAFGHFRNATLSHFDAEEKTLFPAFEASTGMTMGPTQVMRMEHQQMRGLMDEAASCLASGDEEGYLGHAETLLIMIQQHNLKEENVLYPMCDQHLGAEASNVLQHLQASAGTL